MKRTNEEIRLLAAGNGVRHWQIAKRLGISETWFTRLMRDELKPDMRKRVIDAINQIATEQEA